MISTSAFLSTMVGVGVVTALLLVLIVMLVLSICKTGFKNNAFHIVLTAVIIVLYGLLVFGKFHNYEGKIVNKATVTTTTVNATENTPEGRSIKYYVQIDDIDDFVEVSEEQYTDLKIGDHFEYRIGMVECERF